MTKATFTTERGAKIELTLVGADLSVTINGRDAKITGVAFEDAIPVVFDGRDAKIVVPTSARRQVKTLLQAQGRAACAKIYSSQEQFADEMRARMYDRNSDH